MWYWVVIYSIACCFWLGIPEKGWAQISPASYTFTGGVAPFRQISFLPILPGTGINAGPLRFHPSIGTSIIYSDNIFRTATRRRNDFIHTISPGLQAILPFGGRHRLVADYRASQHYYHRFSENNVLSQEVMGQLNLDFPIGLKVDLKGGHVEGYDQRGAEFDLQLRDLTLWNTDSFVGQVQYLGPRVGFSLKVFSTNWNYENNNQAPIRDRQHTGADITFFIPISSSTSALFGFEVDDYNFSENNQLDNFSYTINTGIRLASTNRVSGEFRVGYQVLNFDHSQIIQPAGSMLSNGGEGRENIYIQGNLNWRPTSRFNVSLNTFRGFIQSGVFTSSTITQTGVSLLATQKIRDRLSLRSGMIFIDNKYNNQSSNLTLTGRQDNLIRGNLGFDYRTIQWLGLRVEYIFQKRFSNVNQFDFYANSFMVSLQGVL